MVRNGGGDALDALIAAVGASRAWHSSDRRAIARHPRYPREGRLYV
jgi:outer membrane biosynthesis protein TonB